MKFMFLLFPFSFLLNFLLPYFFFLFLHFEFWPLVIMLERDASAYAGFPKLTALLPGPYVVDCKKKHLFLTYGLCLNIDWEFFFLPWQLRKCRGSMSHGSLPAVAADHKDVLYEIMPAAKESVGCSRQLWCSFMQIGNCLKDPNQRHKNILSFSQQGLHLRFFFILNRWFRFSPAQK